MNPSNASESAASVPLLCDGRWQVSEADRFEDVFNPSTGQVIGRVPMCGADEVARIVEAAAGALPTWSATPAIDRARVLFRLHGLVERSAEQLAQLITREHGKTLSESRAEVTRGLEMIEFACGMPSLLMGENLANIAPGVDAETNRHPVGVCVGITPYNFPSMVPLWMLPVAIVCGNTFILKPSEKVPLSAVRIGELLLEAGLPAGVLSIVHGDRECVDALLAHPQVTAVSFVGSTNVARAVFEAGTRQGKRVQAAGGAKNHLIVMPDADVELTVKALAASAYGCSGQRCMAGSVVVAVGAIGDRLVDRLCAHASQLRVGATDGASDIDVGPLIRPEHRARVASYLDVAREEGACVALDGRDRFESEAFLLGPSVVDQVQPEMRLASEEIFGPVLSVIRVDDIDQAMAVGRACPYGNGASIFTRDGAAARRFKHEFNAGMIGINVGVPAPMAWFPFTGWNRSFFGDLHIQGREGMLFYTRQKTSLTRWFHSPSESHHDPVWKSAPGK
ncbi:MAG: CoA-acylating methylmalonate-semialdehyde dehydrogenase [Pirellulales bacterium]